MGLSDLAFLARLPFAVLADVLADVADRIDTRLADACNDKDET